MTISVGVLFFILNAFLITTVKGDCPTNLSQSCMSNNMSAAYLYNGTCYVLSGQKNSWSNMTTQCLSQQRIFNADYSRVAVLNNNAMFTNITTSLLNLVNTVPVTNVSTTRLLWLGPRAKSIGSLSVNQLSDYCWMSEEIIGNNGGNGDSVEGGITVIPGSQVSPQAIPVQIWSSQPNVAYCLAANLLNPFAFEGIPCTTADMYMICEYGCDSPEPVICAGTEMCNEIYSPAGCGNPGVCSLLQNDTAATAVTCPPTNPSTCNVTEACSNPHLAAMAMGPTYLYGDTCYVLSTTQKSWESDYTATCNSLVFAFYPYVNYGRAATFTNTSMYLTIMSALQTLAQTNGVAPVQNGQPYPITLTSNVWLGGVSIQNGTHLSDYCWVTSMNGVSGPGTATFGSAVSSSSTLVNCPPNANPSSLSPLCLAVNISQPLVFYGESCTSPTPNYYMICELGCALVTAPNAYCQNPAFFKNPSCQFTGGCFEIDATTTTSTTTTTTTLPTTTVATTTVRSTTPSTTKSSTVTSTPTTTSWFFTSSLSPTSSSSSTYSSSSSTSSSSSSTTSTTTHRSTSTVGFSTISTPNASTSMTLVPNSTSVFTTTSSISPTTQSSTPTTTTSITTVGLNATTVSTANTNMTSTLATTSSLPTTQSVPANTSSTSLSTSPNTPSSTTLTSPLQSSSTHRSSLMTPSLLSTSTVISTVTSTSTTPATSTSSTTLGSTNSRRISTSTASKTTNATSFTSATTQKSTSTSATVVSSFTAPTTTASTKSITQLTSLFSTSKQLTSLHSTNIPSSVIISSDSSAPSTTSAMANTTYYTSTASKTTPSTMTTFMTTPTSNILSGNSSTSVVSTVPSSASTVTTMPTSSPYSSTYNVTTSILSTTSSPTSSIPVFSSSTSSSSTSTSSPVSTSSTNPITTAAASSSSLQTQSVTPTGLTSFTTSTATSPATLTLTLPKTPQTTTAKMTSVETTDYSTFYKTSSDWFTSELATTPSTAMGSSSTPLTYYTSAVATTGSSSSTSQYSTLQYSPTAATTVSPIDSSSTTPLPLTTTTSTMSASYSQSQSQSPLQSQPQSQSQSQSQSVTVSGSSSQVKSTFFVTTSSATSTSTGFQFSTSTSLLATLLSQSPSPTSSSSTVQSSTTPVSTWFTIGISNFSPTLISTLPLTSAAPTTTPNIVTAGISTPSPISSSQSLSPTSFTMTPTNTFVQTSQTNPVTTSSSQSSTSSSVTMTQSNVSVQTSQISQTSQTTLFATSLMSPSPPATTNITTSNSVSMTTSTANFSIASSYSTSFIASLSSSSSTNTSILLSPTSQGSTVPNLVTVSTSSPIFPMSMSISSSQSPLILSSTMTSSSASLQTSQSTSVVTSTVSQSLPQSSNKLSSPISATASTAKSSSASMTLSTAGFSLANSYSSTSTSATLPSTRLSTTLFSTITFSPSSNQPLSSVNQVSSVITSASTATSVVANSKTPSTSTPSSTLFSQGSLSTSSVISSSTSSVISSSTSSVISSSTSTGTSSGTSSVISSTTTFAPNPQSSLSTSSVFTQASKLSTPSSITITNSQSATGASTQSSNKLIFPTSMTIDTPTIFTSLSQTGTSSLIASTMTITSNTVPQTSARLIGTSSTLSSASKAVTASGNVMAIKTDITTSPKAQTSSSAGSTASKYGTLSSSTTNSNLYLTSTASQKFVSPPASTSTSTSAAASSATSPSSFALATFSSATSQTSLSSITVSSAAASSASTFVSQTSPLPLLNTSPHSNLNTIVQSKSVTNSITENFGSSTAAKNDQVIKSNPDLSTSPEINFISEEILTSFSSSDAYFKLLTSAVKIPTISLSNNSEINLSSSSTNQLERLSTPVNPNRSKYLKNIAQKQMSSAAMVPDLIYAQNNSSTTPLLINLLASLQGITDTSNLPNTVADNFANGLMNKMQRSTTTNFYQSKTDSVQSASEISTTSPNKVINYATTQYNNNPFGTTSSENSNSRVKIIRKLTMSAQNQPVSITYLQSSSANLNKETASTSVAASTVSDNMENRQVSQKPTIAKLLQTTLSVQTNSQISSKSTSISTTTIFNYPVTVGQPSSTNSNDDQTTNKINHAAKVIKIRTPAPKPIINTNQNVTPTVPVQTPLQDLAMSQPNKDKVDTTNIFYSTLSQAEFSSAQKMQPETTRPNANQNFKIESTSFAKILANTNGDSRTSTFKNLVTSNITSANIVNEPQTTTPNFEGQPITTTVYSGNNNDDGSCHPGEWGPFSACSNNTCGPRENQYRTRKRFSLINPSINCTKDDSDTETILCDIPFCNPMDQLQQEISHYMMDIGCTWILVALGLAILAFVILRHYYYLQIIHVNEDISLFLAHLTLLIFAMKKDAKFNHNICKIAALGLQYFFSVTFLLQTFEALHIYTVLWDVVTDDKAFLGIKTALAIAWGLPMVITGITGATSFKRLMSDFACWVNYGDTVMFATFVPIAMIAWPCAILLEATGGGITKRQSHNINSCKGAQGGLIFVFGAQFASWFMSSNAIYYQHISLFSIVFGINALVGVLILVYHVFCNEKARTSTKKIYRRAMIKLALVNSASSK